MSSAPQPIPIDLGVSEADLPKTLKVQLDPSVLVCSLCGSSMIGDASGRGGLAELMYCSNGSCLASKTTYRIPEFEVREVVRVPAKEGPPLILTASDGPSRSITSPVAGAQLPSNGETYCVSPYAMATGVGRDEQAMGAEPDELELNESDVPGRPWGDDGTP